MTQRLFHKGLKLICTKQKILMCIWWRVLIMLVKVLVVLAMVLRGLSVESIQWQMLVIFVDIVEIGIQNLQKVEVQVVHHLQAAVIQIISVQLVEEQENAKNVMEKVHIIVMDTMVPKNHSLIDM